MEKPFLCIETEMGINHGVWAWLRYSGHNTFGNTFATVNFRDRHVLIRGYSSTLITHADVIDGLRDDILIHCFLLKEKLNEG